MPPSNDTIAVIIPTFNSARFVERAIRSALGEQAATEVIVVDDASSDDTLEVVSALAKSEPRLRIFAQNSNTGPSAARNWAIREAGSAWIALLDADDAYVEGRLAKLLALAETWQADMVADNLVYYDGYTQEALGPSVHPHPSPRTITLEKLFRSTPEGGKDYVTLKPMMKRSFLLQREISYDEAIRNGEDFDLYAKCLAGGAKYVADLEQMTYLYTSRASGTSQTTISDQINVRQSSAWSSHPQFAGRADRLQLVRDRIDILRRRELDRRSGDAGFVQRLGTLRLALSTSAGRRWLAEWLRNRIARRSRVERGGR